MRIALLSPFPPSKSGIADYSAALAGALAPLASLTLIRNESELPALAEGVLPLYQIGNNGAHGFVYETAIRRPGVVVLHEANLHHLIAEITIKYGDWDRYLREVEFDGGPRALDYARAVRSLEVGPDYEGVPMLRRVLGSARGLIVHSRYVGEIARECGYDGPLAVIPHGAWLPEIDGAPWREKLGIGAETPLIGTFGHLKPYKRLREMLRAFRRLARRNPFAKLILVGEEHPDLPLDPLLDALDLRAQARVIGRADIGDFVGYMAACDVVVNLRYPTVGESSGSMLRALGLAKPVLVSEVGAFAEFPDGVCLKVPVGGAAEEEIIYEYLCYLTEDPEAARVIGQCARDWVAETCNWNRVAAEYLAFCEQVAAEPCLAPVIPLAEAIGQDAILEPETKPSTEGAPSGKPVPTGEPESVREPEPAREPALAVAAEEPVPEEMASAVAEAIEPEAAPEPSPSEPEEAPEKKEPLETVPEVQNSPSLPQLETPIAQEMLLWARSEAAMTYLMLHLSRLVETIEMLPEGDESQRVLEMGCYMQLTPLLRETRGYGEVRGCYYGPLGSWHEQTAESSDGRIFSCIIDEFDAERDPYPYPDGHFDAVLCTELFEHLSIDPMHCLWEINRILKPGGWVLLSTPNVCSLRAVAAILGGYHPGFFPAFIKPGPDGPSDPRHHREYAPREIQQGLQDAGFEVTVLRTGAYWNAPAPEHAWVEHLLQHYEFDESLRGECIFALGRKTGEPRERFPQWLYYA